MCKIDDYLELLKQCASQYGVGLTENAGRIANFRQRAGIPITVCVCDQKDKKRGCISEKCMQEIQEKGTCHCNCFKKIKDL